MSVRNIDRYTRIQGKTASLATAKLAIFGTDILWKSCFKLNLEQLFHTMSIVNITILAVARKNMSIHGWQEIGKTIEALTVFGTCTG